MRSTYIFYIIIIITLLLSSTIIYTLNLQLSNLEYRVKNYDNKISTLNDKIFALNNTLNSLRQILEHYRKLAAELNREISMLNMILNLSYSEVIINTSITINSGANLTYIIDVDYPGYLNISIDKVNNNIVVVVLGYYDKSTYVYKAKFDTTSQIIPVLPGKVKISICNMDNRLKRIYLKIILVY